jgi:hypothetical protein
MKNHFIALISMTLVLVAYQNCSDQTFSAKSSTQSSVEGGLDSDGGSTGGGTPEELEEEVIQVKVNCDNALKLNKLKKLKQQITFDDTKVESGRSQVCSFNSGSNLEMKNEFMQARYEQSRSLNLPANAVICDLKMSTPLQQFKYDDVFIFTFNNRILATNNKTALVQNQPERDLEIMSRGRVPIYKYDWLNFRALRFLNVADDYCLGASQGTASCQWPITEQNGQIHFDFDQQLLIALGLLSSTDRQEFSFIITGDNDPSLDCYHERLDFEMNVDYYLE